MYLIMWFSTSKTRSNQPAQPPRLDRILKFSQAGLRSCCSYATKSGFIALKPIYLNPLHVGCSCYAFLGSVVAFLIFCGSPVLSWFYDIVYVDSCMYVHVLVGLSVIEYLFLLEEFEPVILG